MLKARQKSRRYVSVRMNEERAPGKKLDLHLQEAHGQGSGKEAGAWGP